MSPNSKLRLRVRTSVVFTVFTLAACGASASNASNQTSSPATKAQAQCTVAAAMLPITAKFNTATTQVTAWTPSDLKCASGIARLTVLIGPISAPAGGPQSSEHLVLLEDDAGKWLIANDILCNQQGYPTRKTPPELGILCGFQ